MAMSIRTKAELLFSSRIGREPQGVVVSPGRVVLLGEHLDHQQGSVLAVPTAEGVAVAWALRPDTRTAVWAMNARAKDHFTHGEWIKTGRRWSDLARGACAYVANHRRCPGLDLMIFGDLKVEQGLASSAAYLVSIFCALYGVLDEEPSPTDIVKAVRYVESKWAGVSCGPLDPYIAMVGQPGDVLHINCRNASHETLSLPEGTQVTTRSSGFKRKLSNTPYNARRKELARALDFLQKQIDGLESLTDLSLDDFERVARQFPPHVAGRVRHVVTESERVRRGRRALETGDPDELGRLMNECHESLSVDFASSLEQIDEKVHAFQQEEDVYGARLQGAGWGGRIAVLQREPPPSDGP